ncbi:MAG: DUF4412 domain-containing protein [Crocinitomix sp.]|nr:DUF4412 domain-containing protein [Crocinitomix sp.]
MKNTLLILAVFLLPILSYSQSDDFQGTIKYEFSYEGEGADYMAMIGFSDCHYYFGDKKFRLSLNGGMGSFLNDFIVDIATDKTVMIDDDNQIVYTIEDDPADEVESTAEVVVETTKVKEKIMGYKCLKYIVTETTDSSETVTEYWTTTKINVNTAADIGFVSALSIQGVAGFPLRIVTTSYGLTMTQEATFISDDPPSKYKFEIPSTYAAKDFSESPLMQLVNEEEEE